MPCPLSRTTATLAVWLVALPTHAGPPLRITVVDSRTSRGVPLVELSTTSGVVFVTDSAGVVAFDEPGVMDSDVFFHVRSHGYSFPRDGFGFAGTKVHTTPGGSVTLKIDRVNLAERLYRVTGGGIYRDSVMLGDRPEVAQPLINGGVLGQDSVQTIIYRGTLRWFWGDTNRASYPLGNFSMSGAVSDLPGHGGLDPSVGVNLRYFTGADGFSRGMCPIKDMPGPVWVDGLVTVGEGDREAMLCHFVRVKTLEEMYEQGFAEYNDRTDTFEPCVRVALDAPLHMAGHAVRHQDADGDYWYFATPFPLVRCRAERADLLDVSRYEGYTCLKAGTRYRGATSELDRDANGRLVYGWKRDTSVVRQKEQEELVKAGMMKSGEGLIGLHDAASGKQVLGHAGSVFYNEYRKRWIMIVQEGWGSSMCGEIWYAEAPTLVGPWEGAVKIITHEDYSFYNVMHHPYFDQEGGRMIYLEGTYTNAFSGTKTQTPRYDYNQVMYRLDVGEVAKRLGDVSKER